MRKILTILIILSSTGTSWASDDVVGFMLPDELLNDCTNANGASGTALCAGFIQGVFDELSLARELLHRPACSPEHLNLGVLRDIVVDYLRSHPASRDGAASLVHSAISEKYCPAGQASLAAN